MYMNTIKADSYNHLCLYHKTILVLRTTFWVTKLPYMIPLSSDDNSWLFSPKKCQSRCSKFCFFSSMGKLHSIQGALTFESTQGEKNKSQLKTASLHQLKNGLDADLALLTDASQYLWLVGAVFEKQTPDFAFSHYPRSRMALISKVRSKHSPETNHVTKWS